MMLVHDAGVAAGERGAPGDAHRRRRLLQRRRPGPLPRRGRGTAPVPAQLRKSWNRYESEGSMLDISCCSTYRACLCDRKRRRILLAPAVALLTVSLSVPAQHPGS